MEQKSIAKERSILNIHDLKETSKRTSQFVKVAIFFAFVTIITNSLYGNYLSTALVAGLTAAMWLLLWLNITGYYACTKVCIIVLLNAFLILIALAEGFDTGSFLYFFPLLFAIPYLVDNHKRYNTELAMYWGITLLSFCTILFVCKKDSTWQIISEEVQLKMLYTNSFCVFFLCATFAYLSIFLERKYAAALMTQIDRAEEAMEARSKFLSNMGHELRTPLNGIIGATNLLRKGESLPQQSQYLSILKYCSDHMIGLVNDVLDFNKIEAGQLEIHPSPTNLQQLLQQCTLPFYNRFDEKQLELRVIMDEKLDLVVLADDLRLVQVLNNLLSNALKFTERGFVKLQADLKERKEDTVTVQFAVEDTGIGIKLKDQQRIFSSFWQVFDESTRKYGGSGLGLAICDRLLNLMNSSMKVESTEGVGSTFYFDVCFPVVADATKIEPRGQVASDLKGIRILLAEDNIINMIIAAKMLEEWNAELTKATDGEQALRQLEIDSDYDLVLLDLEMPNVDGYTAVKQIKALYPHLPVLAFTATLMDNAMMRKLLDIGFLDCVLKPFQPMDFLNKIRKYTAFELDEMQ
jgi:signal transduction histidine kinase